MVDTITRGIRNHNPGNIRSTALTKWNGEIKPSDNGYARFITPVWGIRAIAINLWHYYRFDGCKTYADGINRWAPPNENATAIYTSNVCRWCNANATDTFPIMDTNAVIALIKAIIQQENGQQPYSDITINTAVRAAGYWIGGNKAVNPDVV